MTRHEFFVACTRHDWYYPMIDGPGYFEGAEAHRVLRAQIGDDPVKMKMFADFSHAHRMFGERGPYPKAEDYDLE
jgi:hypothetical protein